MSEPDEPTELSAARATSPGVGQSDEPRAAAAASQDAAPSLEKEAPPEPAPAVESESAPDPLTGLAQKAGLGDQAAKVAGQYETIARDKPELIVAAAFAGGFLFARLLRAIGS